MVLGMEEGRDRADRGRAGFIDPSAPQLGFVGWDGAVCKEAEAGPWSVIARGAADSPRRLGHVGRSRPRLLDEALPLGVALEEQVEAGGEDVLGVGAGHGVGERQAHGLQLLQERSGDGEVR
jgi:hypothetical protein